MTQSLIWVVNLCHTYYPCYDRDELYEHIRVFMSDHCVWDNSNLVLSNCPQPRDMSRESVQIFPVLFKELNNINEFRGVNREAVCIIIPVLYSRRCDLFCFFKSIRMRDDVHTNTPVSIVFGVKINRRVINRLKVILRGSGIKVNECVKHIKLKTEDHPSVLRNTFIHTLFAMRYLYKYHIHSSHDVRAGITFDNIEKWADTVFAVEDDSDDVTDGSVGVIDGGTPMSDEESSEDIEIIEGDE